MEKCKECGMPQVQLTDRLPNYVVIRLTRKQIAQLIQLAQRQDSTTDWIGRGMIYEGLQKAGFR